MKEHLKNTLVTIGFAIAALILSLAYMWISPYLLEYFFASILMTDKETLIYLLPSPYIIFIGSWIYSTGIYFTKHALITIAEVLVGLSVVVGMIISVYRWIFV